MRNYVLSFVGAALGSITMGLTTGQDNKAVFSILLLSLGLLAAYYVVKDLLLPHIQKMNRVESFQSCYGFLPEGPDREWSRICTEIVLRGKEEILSRATTRVGSFPQETILSEDPADKARFNYACEQHQEALRSLREAQSLARHFKLIEEGNNQAGVAEVNGANA